MKIIMHTTYSDTEHKTALDNVFTELELTPHEWKQKISKTGKYKSYSLKITVKSKKLLESVYEKLNSLQEVKLLL